MLPTIDLCGLSVTRLILGGNPFSGFSHQSHERDEEMLNYYTVERLKETLRRAEAAGLNTTIMRSDLHVHRLLREYYNEGGTLQWIAQVGADSGQQSVSQAIDAAVAAGAKAIYIHGGHVDQAYAEQDAGPLTEWLERIRRHHLPAGVAGHAPEAHLWVHSLGIADFHAVCFYNCGSLHRGGGDRFDRADPPRAVAAIQQITVPCIAYKILGAGRVPAREAFEYAFANIKRTDAVNVGIYRGDNDRMVEEDAALTAEILARPV
ncbi:MAG: hypothetical protein GX774_20500 [Armatimonadetes bacterium]|jgi:hypothetical protein|nr:hypothetical protein [Armatimonadota bacterium]